MSAVKEVAGLEIKELTIEQIREIYAERIPKDFAPDEIKPLSRIEDALSKGHYACYGAFDGNLITSYAFFVINGDDALLDYLAVREDLRGSGTGSEFLQGIRAGLLRRFERVLLESENPDYAETDDDRKTRERRLRFYRKNGLMETGVLSTVWNVPYRVLQFPDGKSLSADETREVYRGLYKVLLPEELCKKMVCVQ